MATRTIAGHLASLIQARRNCIQSGNAEWLKRHTDSIRKIEREWLPSGSGIDSGTTVDLDRSTPIHLVLLAPYHHLNDQGCYDGWTKYQINVRPTFNGICVSISGRDRHQVKDYLADVFQDCLSQSKDL